MAADYQKKYKKDYDELCEKCDRLEGENKALKKENKILKDELKYLRENIENIVNAAVAKATAPLLKEIEELKEENTKLRNEVSRLKNQINKDSTNSSKPSSTNGFKSVIQNNREKTNKNQGGQNGHKGDTLKVIENPDKIIEHKHENCECGGKIKNAEYKSKQEINIRIITEVTEHRYYNGKCSKCNRVYRQELPKELNNPANYGASVKSFITFLNNQGIVSINRSSEFLKLITDGLMNVSKGTVCNWNTELSNKFKGILEQIKEKILNAEVLHVDETPIKVNGKQMYVHNASTKECTYQIAHKKRGKEAIEEIGILPEYCGTIVSDHYTAYYNYGQENAECNVHITRYLKNIEALTKHDWAKKLLDFLYMHKESKEKRKEEGFEKFEESYINNAFDEYDSILKNGLKEYEDSQFKEDEERKLISRLKKYKKNHLMFITNFKVPFENNQAEQDLRGVKTKQKIGKFRCFCGAEVYSIIRSVESTCRKKGLNFLNIISKSFQNQPITI